MMYRQGQLPDRKLGDALCWDVSDALFMYVVSLL